MAELQKSLSEPSETRKEHTNGHHKEIEIRTGRSPSSGDLNVGSSSSMSPPPPSRARSQTDSVALRLPFSETSEHSSTRLRAPKFPQAKRKPRMGGKKNGRRFHSNSTSSLYVTSTINSPDLDALISSMACAFELHCEAGHACVCPVFIDMFDEQQYPIALPVDTPPFDVPPSRKIIHEYIGAIFKAERLSSECGIMCIAYIERIMLFSGITLHATNWRRVVLAALVVASKVWEDQAVWNVDFKACFPCVEIRDLRLLEKEFLNLIGFNVSLSGSLFAKYYFDLRSLAENNCAGREFSMKPLDKEGQRKLEQRSAEMETEHLSKLRKLRGTTRSASDADQHPLKSPRVILS